jgi:4-carboxymuconolactone decarboxylase
MTRLDPLRPDILDEDQRRLYQQITGGQRARGPQHFRLTDDDGRLLGPFNAMLLRPGIGGRLQALGSAIRYDGGLSDRAREIAVLAVAAHWNSAFERYAHEPIARAVGIGEQAIVEIRDQEVAALDDPAEALVLRLVRALLERQDIDDVDYAEAEAVLGAPGIFELTTLVGYYSTLAMQLRVFRADDPPGR